MEGGEGGRRKCGGGGVAAPSQFCEILKSGKNLRSKEGGEEASVECEKHILATNSGGKLSD